MSSQTIRLEGKELNLLPFTFLDKIGSAIYKCFGEQHDIVKRMWEDRKVYGKRGIFYVDTKQQRQEPAFALTKDEIAYLRDSYSKSQEIF